MEFVRLDITATLLFHECSNTYKNGTHKCHEVVKNLIADKNCKSVYFKSISK